ncbi:porin family protein [Thalassolituus oleivorans]|jgi:opacity protein-like surface antigen|uniref:porin family protein n=1 Tax=Thalassolituus oleivorans TaxID=187493 RepID=UPI00042DC464|nr:porin family protein [Thalassolituus oleivorans]AHK17771.1 hypothetical protein R615_13480 [Thalassolituus oleivorans R6-15]PCI49881.1 MAG: porin family protein [Oceanospirillales bacterium]
MLKRNIIVGVLLGSSALYASAENKMSAEILLGMADQELSTSGLSTSGDDVSFGIRGAISLHKNVSAEISYHNYGEADDTYVDGFGDTINDKLTTTAFNLGVKGIFPLNNGLSLNARLGVSIWDSELKETDSSFPGQTFKADDDGTDLYYGVGAQYDINSNMYVGAEYTLTKMDISTDGISADLDVDNLSLSLGYKF